VPERGLPWALTTISQGSFRCCGSAWVGTYEPSGVLRRAFQDPWIARAVLKIPPSLSLTAEFGGRRRSRNTIPICPWKEGVDQGTRGRIVHALTLSVHTAITKCRSTAPTLIINFLLRFTRGVTPIIMNFEKCTKENHVPPPRIIARSRKSR
jgi:hypothetical protein